jgi:hypothetical protein
MKQVGGCFENQTERRKNSCFCIELGINSRYRLEKCLHTCPDVELFGLIHTSKNSVMISLFKPVVISVLIPVSM